MCVPVHAMCSNEYCSHGKVYMWYWGDYNPLLGPCYKECVCTDS